MKPTAIVCTSGTGHTRQYALLLSRDESRERFVIYSENPLDSPLKGRCYNPPCKENRGFLFFLAYHKEESEAVS